MDVLVRFEDMPWESPATGARVKAVVHGRQRLRLLELDHTFSPGEWCTDGHTGCVLEGACDLRLHDGQVVRLTTGDTLFIPAGEAHAHMPVVEPGGRVLFLLSETI